MRCIFLLLIACSGSQAATWYASSTGSETNGTLSQPWGVEYSVTNSTANPYIQPGDTVVFLSGTYTCTQSNETDQVGQVLYFRSSGTPEAKITYTSDTLWGFSFDGGLWLNSAVSNVVLKGLRIFYSGSTNRTRDSLYTHPPGITEFGNGNQIVHNLIENTGHSGIASWKGTSGKYIAGNIIRFVGQDDNTDGGNPRGSGMYLQNLDDSAEAIIAGNVSYFNYTTGMKAYGGTDIWGFNFQRNVCALNNEAGIFYHNDNYGSSGVEIWTNFVWNGNPGIRLGYQLGNGGHSNAVVKGNYVVDTNTPMSVVDGWSDSTWTDNVFVNPFRRLVWSLELSGEASGDTASHTMTGNTYWSGDYTGLGTQPFLIKGTEKSLAQWQSDTTEDADAVVNFSVPTSLDTFAFRPSSDTNFVHVVVFNWQTNETATVDLSSFFSANDRLDIYDAQNIPVICSSVIYTSSVLVTLPLTLESQATMLGTFSDRPDTWDGFDARFRAFVIHKSGNGQAPKKPRRNGPGRFRGM